MGEETKNNEKTKKEEVIEEKEIRKNEPNKNENIVQDKNVEERVKEVKKEIKREEPKTNIKETEYKPVEKSKKNTLPIIIVTIIACIALIFSVIFALLNINSEKILSGISIMGVDVSDLTQKEAKEKIEKIVEDKLSEDLVLAQGKYETTVNAKQFSGEFNTEKAVKDAYNIGREGNIIVNNYEILATKLFKKDIQIELHLDEKALNKKIEDISSKIPNTVKQSNYYVEDDELIIVKGKKGLVIQEKELREMIEQEISQISNKYNIITIPTKEVDPDPIDLQKIRDEIYKKPQNAYVSKNPTKVHTHVNGVDFKITIEEAQKLLKKNKKEYVIPLKITIPEKTINDLGKEAFPQLLATYTTRYDPSNYNRSNNLSIAARKINGTIMMPGEIFSYNKVVGARTIEAGYKLAGAYSGGKVIQDVGGGICQVSSTLYNTALLANLTITDRSNHQFETGYVAASRDATVAWGAIDFKFKNSRKYPIKIVASAQNGVCKVSMYGIKEETEYEVVIQSRVTSYISYGVKYEEDKTLKAGKEVVEQSGHNGCKSEAYRILKLNGKVVSRTLLSRDTYDPMQRIVRRGTKKESTIKTNNKKTNTGKKTDTENKINTSNKKQETQKNND